MKNWIINKLEKMGFYKIENLQVGGHCGLCGKWINNKIFSKIWAIGICKNCLK